MITTKKIVLEVTAPEFIGNAIKAAVSLANNHDCLVEFEFRGLIVTAEPGESAEHVYDNYSARFDAIAHTKPQTYEEKHREKV